MSAFIEDGYHQTAYIAPVFGQFDGFWFEYRIASPLDNALFDADQEKQDGVVAREGLICQTLAKYLRKWTLQRRGGSPVEISEANLSRVHPMARMKIKGIVEGFGVPDDPRDLEPPAGYENVIRRKPVQEKEDQQGN